jgi:hypothetical protein
LIDAPFIIGLAVALLFAFANPQVNLVKAEATTVSTAAP